MSEVVEFKVRLHKCPECGKKHQELKQGLSEEEIRKKVAEIESNEVLKELFCVCSICGNKHFRKRR